jgi:hypothetical protein
MPSSSPGCPPRCGGVRAKVTHRARDGEHDHPAVRPSQPKIEINGSACDLHAWLCHSGGEAVTPYCKWVERDEVKPTQVAAEILACDAAAATQEFLELAMSVVDGLDVQFTADALASRQVQDFVADLELGSAGRILGRAIAHQQHVRRQHGPEGCGQRVAAHRGQHGAEGSPRAVGGDHDRNLLVGETALRRPATKGDASNEEIGLRLTGTSDFP